MKTVFQIETGNKDCERKSLLDISTNKKIAFSTIMSLTNGTDSLVFRDNPLFTELPKKTFNYSNFVKFFNRIGHSQTLTVDIYRFIDEHEKVYTVSVTITKWNMNTISIN